MKNKETQHKKVQEMIDCYATSDPLKEMSKIQKENDISEAAVKWIALAGLHGINMNASEIKIKKSSDGKVKVVAKYRPAELPSPGTAAGNLIIQGLRDITYLEENNGESMLSLGIRDGSVDIKVTVRKDYNGEEAVLIFPS
jgi:hypothetical protein